MNAGLGSSRASRVIKQGCRFPKDHQDVVDRATHREPFLPGPRKIVHSISRFGGVSNVDRDGNNTLVIYALEGTISTCATLSLRRDVHAPVAPLCMYPAAALWPAGDGVDVDASTRGLRELT